MTTEQNKLNSIKIHNELYSLSKEIIQLHNAIETCKDRIEEEEGWEVHFEESYLYDYENEFEELKEKLTDLHLKLIIHRYQYLPNYNYSVF